MSLRVLVLLPLVVSSLSFAAAPDTADSLLAEIRGLTCENVILGKVIDIPAEIRATLARTPASRRDSLEIQQYRATLQTFERLRLHEAETWAKFSADLLLSPRLHATFQEAALELQTTGELLIREAGNLVELDALVRNLYRLARAVLSSSEELRAKEAEDTFGPVVGGAKL